MQFQLRDGVILQEIPSASADPDGEEEEAILLDVISEVYFSLNATALQTLRYVLAGESVEATVGRLVADFEADVGDIDEGVTALLASLQEQDLLVPVAKVETTR